MCHILQAFKSVFQIFTQEGWVEIVDETVYSVGKYGYLVVFIFSLYHMFSAVVRTAMQPQLHCA